MKLLACDQASINFDNIKELGNRIIVSGTLAIADNWMLYLNEDGSERWEYLPSSVLFDPDSISTLQGSPLAVQHPGEVNSDNYRTLASQGKVVGSVSTQLNIDRDRNQLDIVAIVYDKPTIDQILSGGITELSPQYYKQIEKHPDYTEDCFIQTVRDYTGCEVSLVKKARGGKDAKLHLSTDAAEITKTLPRKYFLFNQKNSNIEKTMGVLTIDGIDIQIEDRDKQVIEKAIKAMDADMKSIKKEYDDLMAKIAKLEAEKVKLKDMADKLVKENKDIMQKAKDEADQRERVDIIKTALPLFKSADSAFDSKVLADSTNREIKESAIALALDSLPAVVEDRLSDCSDIEIDSYWSVVMSQGTTQLNKDSKEDKSQDTRTTSRLKDIIGSIKQIDSVVAEDAAIKKASDEYYKHETEAWMELVGGNQ